MFVEWAAGVGARNNELLLLPILMSIEFNGQEPVVEQAIERLYDRYHDEMERVVLDVNYLGRSASIRMAG